ncbi:hypothetical protein Lepto7375DRAFT_7486 [Leptolyngbya sp. PCC 7375]|nr:hypothetical protein Lepto7375DRAFT_7486 [Leptolyngbya sp. PCC 7375]
MSTNTKLIRLEDNSLIEVEASVDESRQVAGGAAERVSSSFDKISPLLKKVCTPIANTWQELNKDVYIDQAEVEIGLSFEGEGNLYITKAKTGANLNIKLVMRQKSESSPS